MAYVLAIYYIGWGSRYDGTGNSDHAFIRLFREKETAIQAIIAFIQEEIEEQIDNGTRNDPKFDDKDNMVARLEKYKSYKFEEYMFTLTYSNIESEI